MLRCWVKSVQGEAEQAGGSAGQPARRKASVPQATVNTVQTTNCFWTAHTPARPTLPARACEDAGRQGAQPHETNYIGVPDARHDLALLRQGRRGAGQAGATGSAWVVR